MDSELTETKRQRWHALISRRKARDMGYPETRIIHAACFEVFHFALAEADENGDDKTCDILEGVERAVLDHLKSHGYDRRSASDRIMEMKRALGLYEKVYGSDAATEETADNLLDLHALKEAVMRERAEADLIREIEMSTAGKAALICLRVIETKTKGFPTSIDIGPYLGVSSCIASPQPEGWRVATARDSQSKNALASWQTFDDEMFVEHLLVELGMEDSDLAFGSLMAILADVDMNPTENDRHVGLSNELLQMLIDRPNASSAPHDIKDSPIDHDAPDAEADEDTAEASDQAAAVLGDVLNQLASILGEPLAKKGRGYETPSGRTVKLAQSGPYRKTKDRFFKIARRHFAFDFFVVWRSEIGGGWMIPTSKLSDFLECTPTSNRSNGIVSWDPRIHTREGSDWLWTNAEEHGRMDVTPYRF